jgi:UDP-glucuronate 4-epimerase
MNAPLSPVNTVLVTGAAGFIGSHLCEHLAGRGVTVVGVDNFDPYYARIEKEDNVAALRAAGADFRESDIRDYGDIASLIDVTRPDVIVHLAAKAGVRNSVKFPRQYFETNLLGTQNVLDSCKALGVERLVLASTSSVYGHTKSIPFVEDDPCVEPLHPYAASKRSTELLASTYSKLYELQITVMRFFTVYGERGRPDMMPRLLLDSITDGRPVNLYEGPLERDWTHVSDIVRGLAAAVERPLGFEILNIGRGEPVALGEFISTLEAVSGKSANLVPAPRPASEMMSTYANTDKLRELLGVQPEVSMQQGVEALWNWWQTRQAP